MSIPSTPPLEERILAQVVAGMNAYFFHFGVFELVYTVFFKGVLDPVQAMHVNHSNLQL